MNNTQIRKYTKDISANKNNTQILLYYIIKHVSLNSEGKADFLYMAVFALIV